MRQLVGSFGQRSHRKNAFQSLISAIALALFATGCQPSRSDYPLETPNDPNDQLGCSSATIKNRYIVQWKDGSYTIENAESEEHLKKYFIDPQLDKIQKVSRDFKIQVKPMVQESVSQLDSTTWGPTKIEAHNVWSQGFKGAGVLVGVVDGMVDKNHPQIKNNISSVQQFNQEFNNPSLNKHGTHVAGIIAADPEFGPVEGVAPKAKIIGGQFIGNNGGGSLGDAIVAMNSVANRGAKIINMSWGGAGCSTNLQDALKSLNDRGILLVTAAGNDGINSDFSPSYPATYGFSRQINVAATDSTDWMASFSNRGVRSVQIAAPGVSIVSSIPSNQYQSMDGTSMAAPMVSGAAALLWNAVPNATVDQIKSALLKSVDLPAGSQFQVSTGGRLNVRKALEELRRIAN